MISTTNRKKKQRKNNKNNDTQTHNHNFQDTKQMEITFGISVSAFNYDFHLNVFFFVYPSSILYFVSPNESISAFNFGFFYFARNNLCFGLCFRTLSRDICGVTLFKLTGRRVEMK